MYILVSMFAVDGCRTLYGSYLDGAETKALLTIWGTEREQGLFYGLACTCNVHKINNLRS